MATAHTEVRIDAPIDVVWQVMLDTDAYGEWNPFIVKVDRLGGRAPEVGDDLRLHVRWKSGGRVTTVERITALDPPRDGSALLEYDFLGPFATLRMVRGRRRQELTAEGDATRYVTGETLRGWLSWAAPIGRVQDGFERHATALKQRAEQLHRAAGPLHSG
ncbi:MAG TPA: SRPBCC domain-containing protein [Mycobacteriales bacterium]|nr:SRPBCC domain-containing protein [Mycobacteriales bacterium]